MDPVHFESAKPHPSKSTPDPEILASGGKTDPVTMVKR
jgi:hypothetical protein